MARAFTLLVLAVAVCMHPACAYTLKEQKIWSNAYFPQSRPLLYNFRDFSQVQSASCTKQSSGAYIIKVVHKPITGVTPDMLTWMFTQGLRMSSTDSRDDQTYPNFLRYHPRDHIHHDADPKTPNQPLAPKDMTHWLEFPATGCNYGGSSMSTTCGKAPAANPGVLFNTSESVWKLIDQTNANSTLKAVGKGNPKYPSDPKAASKPTGSVTFWNQGCKTENGKQTCYPSVIITQHSWTNKGQASADTIVVTTTQTIGINRGAKAAVQANQDRIVPNWANGILEAEKCDRIMLHFIEEIGSIGEWLPEAWKQAKGLNN